MRRPALVALALLLCGTCAFGQASDLQLLRRADFGSVMQTETAPEGANGVEKAMYAVRKQLTGRDFYDPPNYMFFRQAVRSIGFVPAFFATSDRLLRDSRLGTVRTYLNPDDPVIHEGPEAYSLRRAAGRTAYARPTLVPRFGFQAPGTDAGGPAARWVSQDYDFAQYLLDNDLKTDASTLLASAVYHPSDTLTFLKGWTEYQLKHLEPSAAFFDAVPRGSSFYERSFFYSNAISAHLGDYTGPVKRLEEYSGPYAELKGVQLAGLALLRDDPEAFRSAAESFRYNDFALEAAERELSSIYRSRYEAKRKSPWLAAAASAVVPGLGKVYAGQIGEGISAFLLTGAMGAISAEHWLKDGPGNWKTIVPMVIGGILYIGNIYGSYMSVSIYNQRINDAQTTAVLYNIHIPLRSVFR